MAIRLCTDVANTSHRNVIERDLSEMTRQTTPEQFVKRIMRNTLSLSPQEYLQCQGHEDTFLMRAVRYAPQLIDTIVRLGGPGLLNLGNRSKITPLACLDDQETPIEERLLTARRLIELGADVNLASELGHIPLSQALKANEKALAKLYLANGASTVVPQELFDVVPLGAGPAIPDEDVRMRSKMQPKRLAQAQKEIDDESRATNQQPLSDALAELPALLRMPRDICTIVAGFAPRHPMTLR